MNTRRSLLDTGKFREVSRVGGNVKFMTFVPEDLDIIKDVRVTVFDNLTSASRHRFLIEFSLNRPFGGTKAGEYVKLLEHNAWCNLDNSNTGRDEWRKKYRADNEPLSIAIHDALEDFFVDRANEVSEREITKASRINGDLKRTTKMWYGLSKTAAGQGKLMVEQTAALWMGDFNDNYSGMFYFLFGSQMYTIRVEKCGFQKEFDNGRRAIAHGKLIK